MDLFSSRQLHVDSCCFSRSNLSPCFLGGAADRFPDLVYRRERRRAAERRGGRRRRRLPLRFQFQRGDGGRLPSEALGARRQAERRGFIRPERPSPQERFATKHPPERRRVWVFARQGSEPSLHPPSGSAAARRQPPFLQSSSVGGRSGL